jgi:hypothetical protein
MGRTCSIYREEDISMEDVSGDMRRKETTRKA